MMTSHKREAFLPRTGRKHLLVALLFLQQHSSRVSLSVNGLSSFRKGYVRFNEKSDMFSLYVQTGDDFDSPFSLQTLDIVHSFSDVNTVAVRVNREQYEEIKNDPNVLRIEPDLVRKPSITRTRTIKMEESDRRRDQPYNNNLIQIQALEAHQFTKGEGVKVCLIDSGVSPNHDDLDMSLFDGLNDEELPWNEDLLGHGTFMAGIINAIPDNDVGVVGVAPAAEVFVVRVFKDSGRNFTFSSGIVNAAYECIVGGATIINMALAGNEFLESELENFDNLVERYGVLLVAAAGNFGPVDRPAYPASYPTVLSVVATNAEMDRWQFSSANDFVDVAAPGVQIRSTGLNSEYEVSSGTSISCAHVSGVAALLWSYKPDATVNEIRDAILNSALDLGPPSTLMGRDPFFGHGLIQTMDAIAYLNGLVHVGAETISPSISSSSIPTQMYLPAPSALPPTTPTATPMAIPSQTGKLAQLGQGLYGDGGNYWFGHTVALNWDGTVLAVGMPRDLKEYPIFRGLVRCYKYTASSDEWQQMGFDLRGDAHGDSFGHSLALSGTGDHLIVGAGGGGYAKVYEWNGVLWVPLGNRIDAEAVDDRTGWAVDFAANAMVVAVGADQYGTQSPEQGSVRVMQMVNGLWQQLGTSIRGDAFEYVGGSLSLSDDGHTVAVGGISPPRVFKWVEDAGAWQQVGDGILFGRVVTMNGNGTIIATGYGNHVGDVSTYRLTGDKWNQYGQPLSGQADFDYFGYHVSLSSDASLLAINSLEDYPSQGLNYLYDWTGLFWDEANPPDVGPLVGGGNPARIGKNIDVSGDGSTAAIGNQAFSSQRGSVLVYSKK